MKRQAHSARRSQRRYVLRPAAFTVIELVMVLSIMAMFGAMAVPRFANFFAQQRAESSVRRIETDLALARRQAKLTGSQRTVDFDLSRDRYTLPGIADPNHPDRTYVVDLSQPPYEASIVSADFGGTAVATFDGYGATLYGGTVVIEVGAYRYTAQLDGPTIEVIPLETE